MKIITSLTLFLVGSFMLYAQENTAIILERQVVANAGFVSSPSPENEIQMSWTLGEAITKTLYNPETNLVLTQGFQQPDKDFKTETIQISKNLSVDIFPNPVYDRLFIQVNRLDTTPINLKLFNIKGQLMLERSTVENWIEIPMHLLPSAIYFLEISTALQFVTTKILKV